REQVYVPYAQSPRDRLVFAVAAPGSPAALLPSLRRALTALDRDIPLARARRLSRAVAEARTTPRFAARGAGLLAMLSLALTAIGVYGVAAGNAAERTREIGVRIALGAEPSRVVRMMLADGGRPVAAGVAAGAAGAVAARPLLAHLVFGVGPGDPA